jgi:nucleotide-binding universal stress UspA family protein
LVSLTVGRRVVARIIVWCNDNLTIEVPVISAILLIMLAMALTTDLIGVHSALGAFVAGILIGQSPILTEHIESQLRGFIIAFFSPVFFAVAGLGMDLRTLLDPALLGFTLAVILIASIGKFLGALAGGMLGGLNWLESLALATGLNARGSTEVIIATIGLSMGALSSQLYTMIVAMAVATTMVMPPTLRWMMGRVPLRDEELRRLDKEEAEESESLPRMERALVYVDGSANGELTAILAGLFAAHQGVLTTVLEMPREEGDKTPGRARLMEAANAARQDMPEPSEKETPAAPKPAIEQLVQARSAQAEDAIEKESAKGYSIAFVGIGQPISLTTPRFEEPLQGLVAAFDGPIAILLNGGRYDASSDRPLDILVPTGGSADSRLATEIALTLAAASRGTLTALHVFDPREDTLLLRGRARRLGISVLVEAHRLGKRSGVAVKGLTATSPRPETEIRRVARRGRYDLVVLGTSLRQGETKFLGPRTLGLVQSLRAPVLLIAR